MSFKVFNSLLFLPLKKPILIMAMSADADLSVPALHHARLKIRHLVLIQ